MKLGCVLKRMLKVIDSEETQRIRAIKEPSGSERWDQGVRGYACGMVSGFLESHSLSPTAILREGTRSLGNFFSLK